MAEALGKQPLATAVGILGWVLLVGLVYGSGRLGTHLALKDAAAVGGAASHPIGVELELKPADDGTPVVMAAEQKTLRDYYFRKNVALDPDALGAEMAVVVFGRPVRARTLEQDLDMLRVELVDEPAHAGKRYWVRP